MTREELHERFVDVRRRVIAQEFSHLNDMQRQAVLTTQGPLLLLAGAGSGKTTVLINRIANLIKYGAASDSDYVPERITEEDLAFLEHYAENPTEENFERAYSLTALEPTEPWRMIAITFTNKAADELKARLERMLGPEANDIWAMTFHSACVRILRRDIEKLGFDRSFTIYDTSDSQSLMKRVLKDLELDEKTFPVRSVLSSISRSKDAMVDADTYCAAAERSGDVRKKYIGRAYSEYSRRMAAANALDFDDLILFTVKLLQEFREIREYYQKKFKYVLIDEYQDTNNLQYLLASLLVGPQQNICVVGDDDQSIYKFRGATIENILNFENQYNKARTIRLEQNYRSKGYILEAANAVIKNNQGRKGKKLWTDKEPGERIRIYTAQNENDEAQYVAGQILANISNGGKFSDCAVLYRMNAQSNQLEYAMKRNGIPYRIVGGMRFFDRAEVKDMLSYLCCIHNPTDDLRLLRIINTPARGIGVKTIETAASIAAGHAMSIYDVLKHAQDYPELAKSAPRLHQFLNLLDELRELNQSVPLPELYEALLDKTGYVRALELKATEENLNRIENVKELQTNIISYMKENTDGDLKGFLDEIALYTDIEQYDQDAECVVMMTMHSAKGLEFPVVFVVGAEEGIFPGTRAIGEPEEMEEERRLCYVAITRAENLLYITCARQRMLFGRTTANKISRFVEEIPESITEKKGAQKNYSFSSYETGGFPGGGAAARYRPAEIRRPSRSLGNAPMPASVAKCSFQKGDMVNHKAFGRGMITSVQPMGSDALLEIAFEVVGTKRLMMKSASLHMEKI